MTGTTEAATNPTPDERTATSPSGRPEARGKHAPKKTDVWVGNQIRVRRVQAGMSQTDLGHELGLAFQQVQKYEKGTNRVSASRLDEIATILRCDVADFFPRRDRPADEVEALTLVNNFAAMRLMRAFAKIKDATLRASLVTQAESIGHLSELAGASGRPANGEAPQKAKLFGDPGASAPNPNPQPRSGGCR